MSSPSRWSWWSWRAQSAASPSAWRPTRPVTPARRTCRATATILAAKLELADFGVTQFFFEASEYEGLMADLRGRGVDTPVLPGILPVTSLSTMGRLGAMGAAAPAWMQERLRAADERGGADAVRKEGVELATELCSRLLESGVPGLHFYTFNTSSATREIYAALGLGPSTGPEARRPVAVALVAPAWGGRVAERGSSLTDEYTAGTTVRQRCANGETTSRAPERREFGPAMTASEGDRGGNHDHG